MLRGLEVIKMPLYDYVCKKCGEKFERYEKSSDISLQKHSEYQLNECDGELEKIDYYVTGLSFKGSGWYVSDYKNKKD